MTLLAQLDQDLATAMREGVVSRVAVLRLLKSSLKKYDKGGRQDLADSERHELEVIQSYLPQQMDETELAKLVDEVVRETNATSPAEMGVVIGAVIQRSGGRADGGTVSRLVKQRLQ
jgi:uncharacterized protein YqeY